MKPIYRLSAPEISFLRRNFFSIFLSLLAVAGVHLRAEEVKTVEGVEFAKPEGVSLLLDIHIPQTAEDPPLVMFIHGGGWKAGTRKNCRIAWVVEYGYAVASVEYRLSQESLFPAQIHDCKSALRWLKANASRYGYDASRVVVAGTSAGGHLAALLGTSGEVAALEGSVTEHGDYSSRVDGFISYYGPSDFVKRSKNQPWKTDEPEGSVFKLLGGPVAENVEAARLASPAIHVTPDDPPALIFHGDKDRTVFLDQSENLEAVYQEAGLEVHLEVVQGAAHGWKRTDREEQLVLEFLEERLGSK